VPAFPKVLFIIKRFIVTFFVIATKKVTKEKSRQTRSLRAFCLANAAYFVLKLNALRLILFAALRKIFNHQFI
jgi:DnaJ-domain-containing protein 1